MKKEAITYAAVVEVCQSLVNGGEKPSIRKVHERLGGSFSTLSDFMQQWQAQEKLASAVNDDLSDTFKQATLAEFGRITQAVKAKLQAELDQSNERVQEMQTLLKEYESSLEALKQTLTESQEAAKEAQLEQARALATAKAETQAAEKREGQLQAKVDGLREEAKAAELRAVAAETKCIEIEKQLDESKQAQKK